MYRRTLELFQDDIIYIDIKMSFKCRVINSDVRKKYCTNFNDTKCKSSFIGQNFVYFGRK